MRSTLGGHYGEARLSDGSIALALGDGSQFFTTRLDNLAQCVVPTNNRDELEIQFSSTEQAEKQQDCLVQFTLHFPTSADKSEPSEAQRFHKDIIEAGLIKSITGDVIAEFSKEQGDFITPRGRYSLQMTSSYVYMQGAQYAYKILYEDINSFFLLPKLDGGHLAFVISLNKAIKQGNQRYQHLVLNTHNLEQTLKVNLSDDDIADKYGGQLEKEMTMPLSNLIAKVFKVLSDKKVFIPKQFTSARDAYCVRCSIKANEGLLYPLAKAFIFIHKPTVIIKFEDILNVEFKRYEGVSNSATRSFDLVITLKDTAEIAAGEGREYVFMSIDRTEYPNLSSYIESRSIPVKNPVSKAGGEAKGGDVEDDEDEDEEDDENYSGSESSAGDSASDSADSDADEDDDDEEEKAAPKKRAAKAQGGGEKGKKASKKA